MERNRGLALPLMAVVMIASVLVLLPGGASSQTGVSDVAVAKDGPDNATQNQLITYTITVRNEGTVNSSFTLSDTIPANTKFSGVLVPTDNLSCGGPSFGSTGTVLLCTPTAGTFAPGEHGLVDLGLVVTASSGTITNRAELINVSPGETTANQGDNSSQKSTMIVPAGTVTLGVQKTAVPTGTVAPGDRITYTITATVTGNSLAAVNALLSDTIPAGTRFIAFDPAPSTVPPGLVCVPPSSAADKDFECTGTPPPAAFPYVLKFSVEVLAGACGVLTNRVDFNAENAGGIARSSASNPTGATCLTPGPTTTTTQPGGGNGGGGTTTTSPTTSTTAPGGGGGGGREGPTGAQTERLSGFDRIGTSIDICQNTFPVPDSAGAVVIARFDDFPDALASVPLAVRLRACILVNPPNALDPRIQAEIARALPDGGRVVIAGGVVAISSQVEAALRAAGFSMTRYGGFDRFGTATIIADQGLGNPSKFFITSGIDFPDAIAAGAAAAHVDAAILLSFGALRNSTTDSYLTAHPGRPLWAIGGPAVAAYPQATPVFGIDRYGTAEQVARRFFQNPTEVGIATGEKFPDALTGGAHIGLKGGPVLLVRPLAPLPGQTQAYLNENRASIAIAYIYGGEAAISAEVRQLVQTAIE
jgi:uncharacterized repeat protein (TIGR01451 family)